MNERALVAETKVLIAEVEAGQTDRAAWIAIQDRVKLLAEGRSQREVGDLIGRSHDWVGKVLRWDGRDHVHLPQGGRGQDIAQSKSRAKKALRDPKIRAEVFKDLDSTEIEEVIETAHDTAIKRVRAKAKEHRTEPTADEIMDGDRFDPAEYWADTLIIRLNRNARELASLISKAGGLLFGTMSPEEAFDYLHEAERLVAEARAAAQEQVRDRTEVA